MNTTEGADTSLTSMVQYDSLPSSVHTSVPSTTSIRTSYHSDIATKSSFQTDASVLGNTPLPSIKLSGSHSTTVYATSFSPQPSSSTKVSTLPSSTISVVSSSLKIASLSSSTVMVTSSAYSAISSLPVNGRSSSKQLTTINSSSLKLLTTSSAAPNTNQAHSSTPTAGLHAPSTSLRSIVQTNSLSANFKASLSTSAFTSVKVQSPPAKLTSSHGPSRDTALPSSMAAGDRTTSHYSLTGTKLSASILTSPSVWAPSTKVDVTSIPGCHCPDNGTRIPISASSVPLNATRHSLGALQSTQASFAERMQTSFAEGTQMSLAESTLVILSSKVVASCHCPSTYKSTNITTFSTVVASSASLSINRSVILSATPSNCWGCSHSAVVSANSYALFVCLFATFVFPALKELHQQLS